MLVMLILRFFSLPAVLFTLPRTHIDGRQFPAATCGARWGRWVEVSQLRKPWSRAARGQFRESCIRAATIAQAVKIATAVANFVRVSCDRGVKVPQVVEIASAAANRVRESWGRATNAVKAIGIAKPATGNAAIAFGANKTVPPVTDLVR